jgi:hypothetical protein
MPGISACAGERFAMHLRRILSVYAAYYNQTHTHLTLDKDAPLLCPICRDERFSRCRQWF